MQAKRFDRITTRLFEMMPGALTWLVLTSPFWLSFRLPTVVAVMIVFFVVYWFYRAIKTGILSFIGYQKMRRALSTNWISKLEEDFAGEWEKVSHLLVIPSWKERGYIIHTTLSAIARSNYPLSRIHIVLALEERDEDWIKEEKREIAKEYEEVFGGVYVTEHPHGLPGEVVGPGSNRSWALKQLLPVLKAKIDFKKTIVTTLDADFAVHPKFLAGLTYKYLEAPNREKRSFTGVFIYTNNYWQAPAITRLIASTITLGQLAELNESWKYVNFSSHSLNLQSLIDLDFWVRDKVADDTHLYWKAFYKYEGDYRVLPVFLPIYGDTVLDENLWLTFKSQYAQLKRWAYGAEHMPMIVKEAVSRHKISLGRRIERVLFAVRSYLIWSTVALVTGFGSLVLISLNADFARTSLGRNLTYYTGAIMTVAMLGLLNVLFVNERIVPKRPAEWSWWKKGLSYLQWVLSPLVLMTFGTFPAIEAQTRLMLGKYMEFQVTRKFRKTNPK